jgi:hypothetical protein
MQGYDQYGNPWFNPPVTASQVTAVQSQAGHVAVVQNTDPAVAPEQDFISISADWFFGEDVANSPGRDYVLSGQRGSYQLRDGHTTAASPTLTSAADGGFTSALIGAALSGAGIPAGTTVLAVASAVSLTMSANATATASNVVVSVIRSSSSDVIYLRHRGALPPTIGFAVTPPNGSARSQFAASDAEPAMQTARFRVGPAQTGKAVVVHDSADVDQWWLDSTFFQSGPNGVQMGAEPSAAGRVLVLADPTHVANVYGFSLPGSSGGVMDLSYITGGTRLLRFGTDGSVVIGLSGAKIGAYGATAVVRPSVTGSRASGAALVSLLAALGTGAGGIGWLVDNTTA